MKRTIYAALTSIVLGWSLWDYNRDVAIRACSISYLFMFYIEMQFDRLDKGQK